MRLASVALAYKEERMIVPYLKHLEDKVDERFVLCSSKPWYGEAVKDDTPEIAKKMGATVHVGEWESEEAQRNFGQYLAQDYDWIIVLDPDEFILDWRTLEDELLLADEDAFVCELQHTYWKDGYVIDPPEDYKQIIAVRPNVMFTDKRVVRSAWSTLPIELHHFSWARTDEEVWNKISHYGHAKDFDIENWYNRVWLNWKPTDRDFHPLTPSALHKAVPAKLPKELEELNIWPQK